MTQTLFAISSRANYGSVRAVLREYPGPLIVPFASACLDRYGSTYRLIQDDGHEIADMVYCQAGGTSPEDMARTTADGMRGFAPVIRRLRPDVVYVIGDRHEVLGPAFAARCCGVPVAHQMGGEVSGNIDDEVRDALTAFSELHFVATVGAGARVAELGGERIHVTGCPRLDEVALATANLDGMGPPSRPFVMLSYHACTDDADPGKAAHEVVLGLCDAWSGDIECYWPNADAGSDEVVNVLRTLERIRPPGTVRYYRTMPPDEYARHMATTRCLVGNTSSAIREGSFLGTPSVNIGPRQSHRERGPNVMDAPNDAGTIARMVRAQVARADSYPQCELYGDGKAAGRIVGILEGFEG